MKMLNNVMVFIELVYPVHVHPISPSMELDTRKMWDFLSPTGVARFLSLQSQKYEQEE